MATIDLVTLVVKGKAGTDFSVQPRDRGDEPPPPVLQAAVGSKGTASAMLPRGYYVVHGGSKTQPADFTAPDRPKTITVAL